MQHSGGFGPWFVSLYFSLAKKPKKQTDLRVHTYPLLFERMMNGPKASSLGNSGWVLIMSVGYFENWHEAVSFHALWLRQTRGKTRRIQRGIDLFIKYGQAYRLNLWVQPMHKDRAIQAWQTAYQERPYKAITNTTTAMERSGDGQVPPELVVNNDLVLSKVAQIQKERKKRT